MRKVMGLLIGLILMFGVAYADPSDLSLEPLLNKVYNPTRVVSTVVRSAVVTNDTGFPSVGSGVDYTGYSKARVYILSTSTNPVSAPPSWTITPLYGDATASGYFQGQAITVVTRDVYTIDVNGSSDVYYKISGGNGAAGESCSIWSEPIR